ncbi:hypothetical protein V502_03540 [Pseudogymnoascus sp. VKM F-4520 (FW-2644)]|nr:hypothetical protein V502_03540 [Pseudogymnoascus sp. VKM F-4520 (FW-2644)]
MHLSSREQLALEGSKDGSFATDDLNIKSLKSIVTKTLYIAWFLVGMGSRSAMGGFKPSMDTMKSRREESSTLNTEIRYQRMTRWGSQIGIDATEFITTYYNTHPDAYADVRAVHLQDGGYFIRVPPLSVAALHGYPKTTGTPPAMKGQQGLFKLLHLLDRHQFRFADYHPGNGLTRREHCTDVGIVSGAGHDIFAVRLFPLRYGA